MYKATVQIQVERLDEGCFLATSVDVPGLVAEGQTFDEVVEIAQGLALKIVESCVEHGDPIPPKLVRGRRGEPN